MFKNLVRPTALFLAVVMAFSATAFTGAKKDARADIEIKDTPAAVMEVSSGEEAFSALQNGAGQKKGQAESQVKNLSAAQENYPTIVLPGIGQSEVYRLDENGNRAVGDTGQILCLNPEPLKALVTPLVKTIATQKDAGFTQTAYEKMGEAIAANYVNKEGVMPNGVEIIRHQYPLADFSNAEKESFYKNLPMDEYINVVGEDMVYFFAFNPMGEPYKTAEDLDAYIQNVLSQHPGKDKVNLLVLSLGGTISTAYLDAYSSKGQVNKIVNVVAALDGSYLVSDMFRREFKLEDENLYKNFFPKMIEGAGGYAANIALRLLPKQVLYDTLTSLMVQLLETTLINSPSMWALVPYEEYDALADKYLSTPEYAVLRTKTDRFHAAQGNLRNKTLALRAQGVKIFNVSGYGLNFGDGDSDYAFFGLMASTGKVNTDGIIHSASTSMGASFAPVGQTLTSSNSPDGAVNTLTGVLPNQTWFYAGQHHELDSNDATLKLINALLIDDSVSSVTADARFPQFNGSRNTKHLRRTLLPFAKTIDPSTLSPEDAAELSAAIADAEAMMATTIVNRVETIRTTDRLVRILDKTGALPKPPKPSKLSELGTTLAKVASDALYKLQEKNGARGFFDKDGNAARNENIGNLPK